MGVKNFLIFGTAMASLGVPAVARAEDTTVGSEFIDMPSQPATEDATPAVDETKHPEYVPGYRELPSVGMSPYSPQVTTLPAGITPGFGSPLTADGWKFGFSGYLQMPIVASIGTRDAAYVNQKQTVIHGDPVLAGRSWGFFDHTNSVPNPWSQLNFTFGNKTVTATAQLGAWSIGESQNAAGYYQPPSQVWFNNAFITYTPDTGPVKTRVLLGAYPDRYGAMAKYTNGVYSVPLMGQISGVGTTVSVGFPFVNGLTVTAEGGFKGNYNHAAKGMIASNGNEWAFSSVGSTFSAHGHLSVDYEGKLAVGLHAVNSFARDDTVDDAPPIDPDTADPYPKDGSISWVGADLRIDAERFGYFYGGAFTLTGKDSLSVDNGAQVLWTGGGQLFAERFWGMASNGNGGLTVGGLQYTLSLGTLLRHPREFWGDGPDILVTLFGMYGHATSRAKDYDDKHMYKWGSEVTYNLLPWLAASFRLDDVVPDTSDAERSFWVMSPKLIIRTDWQARESLILQYAHYALGNNVEVEGDRRVNNLTSGTPDSDMVAILATMWW